MSAAGRRVRCGPRTGSEGNDHDCRHHRRLSGLPCLTARGCPSGMFGGSVSSSSRCLGESMIGRRRGARSPDRAHRRAVPDNAGDNPAGDSADEAGLVGFAAATRGRVTRVQRWLVKYQDVPVVDVVLGTFRKDRRAAGSVMSSALAFRLFLFCLPLLLLTIGVAASLPMLSMRVPPTGWLGSPGAWPSRSPRHFTSPGSPVGPRCCSAFGASWLRVGPLAGCCTRPARPHGGCRRATTPDSARWALLWALSAQ